ncbi:hypothetical protein EXIGLDRAFT_448801 [Exidia glandulosa HHB12029]|uniref:Uncharacterized protein n=1 Tax=Exidia glandulosa HHB12029 TaxID=1314781 RepID=A0A165B4T9_EXIGL|nr:hypothetical protein EXIGLDRAFT_448801 [Exidia glandulosa HHB12029]
MEAVTVQPPMGQPCVPSFHSALISRSSHSHVSYSFPAERDHRRSIRLRMRAEGQTRITSTPRGTVARIQLQIHSMRAPRLHRARRLRTRSGSLAAVLVGRIHDGWTTRYITVPAVASIFGVSFLGRGLCFTIFNSIFVVFISLSLLCTISWLHDNCLRVDILHHACVF